LAGQKTKRFVKTYYFIKNNDGSTRFVWPVESDKPIFLKFYNSSNWKEMLFRLVVTVVYTFKLQRFFFNRTKMVLPESITTETNWALYLGTPGSENKKTLYTISSSSKEGKFSKISFQESTNKKIAKEIEYLTYLNIQKEKLSFEFPQIISDKDQNILETNEIPFSRGCSNWTFRHSQAIKDLSRINSSEDSIKNWNQWPIINSKIKNLKNAPYSDKLPRNLGKKLSLLKKEINEEDTYQFSLAHGDFTIANTFISKGDKLGIIDWELTLPSAPKGMDFFNFIVQKGILEEKLSVRYIIYEIFEIAQEENLFESEAEILKYLKLYLLFHITHYTDKYANQQYWPKVMSRQIDAWEELLNEITTSWSKRKLFITDLFEFLSDKKYAALKLENSDSPKISEFSDIDLLIKKSDLKAIKKWINERSVVFRVHARTQSCFTALNLTFFDATELNLELICELKQKSTVFQDINHYIRSAQINENGIKQCNPRHTAQYIGLYCSLNNRVIPKKFEEKVNNLLPLRSDLDELVYHFYKNDENSRENLVRFVQKANQNKGTSAFTNKIRYYLDASKELFRQKEIVANYHGNEGSLSYNSDNKFW